MVQGAVAKDRNKRWRLVFLKKPRVLRQASGKELHNLSSDMGGVVVSGSFVPVDMEVLLHNIGLLFSLARQSRSQKTDNGRPSIAKVNSRCSVATMAVNHHT